MSELDNLLVPPWSRLPLVHDDTSLFPADTMTALSATYAVAGSSQFSTILERAQTDATLVVLGDSTGNETTEWVYLFAQWIDTAFPDYKVSYRLWDDATQAYGSATTIGTGTLTVNLYNGAHPGAGYNYPFGTNTRLATMIPVTPDAVIVSYGYNSSTSTYRTQMLELARQVRGSHPTAEYIATSQPPVSTAHADFATNFSRRMDIRKTAATERWGLIDATQAFLDYGNFNSLISGDNLHPNADGSQVWADEVIRYFGSRVKRVNPSIAPAAVDRIFVNASQFMAYVGSPAMSFISGIILPKWDFDAATDEMIATIVDIPPTWASVNVSLLWSVAGGSTNAVVWQVDHFCVSDSMVPRSGQPAGSATAGTPVTVAAVSSPAYLLRVTDVITGERFAAGRPVAFRVRRNGTSGADTYTADAFLYGLLITRAS